MCGAEQQCGSFQFAEVIISASLVLDYPADLKECAEAGQILIHPVTVH